MKSEGADRTYNLPYNQSDAYWIGVLPAARPPQEMHDALSKLGMKPIAGEQPVFAARCAKDWAGDWQTLKPLIAKFAEKIETGIAVIPGEQQPGHQEFSLNRKMPSDIDAIAASLWLGEAIMEDRVRNHMQPVLDKRGKVFGHESFARVITADGQTISGARIFEASRILNIEYMLDRVLHVQAIRTFIESDLGGFLFVNFVPGFIHRPDKYLEGLTEAAKMYNMAAKNIVLDFTRAETPRDALHLRSIFEYCRSKGYSIALDDINSVAMASRLIAVIKPDFIKLDMMLVRDAVKPEYLRTIRDLVQMAHEAGSTVIGEGVETEDVHKALLDVGVDLFQGYLFSPPTAANPRKQVG